MSDSSLSIRNTTREKLPRVAFSLIAQTLLPKDYELSLVFVTTAEAKRITRETKHLDHASNVLAFPLSPTSGEIIICVATAKLQAPEFDAELDDFIGYLFIHGIFHLKGQDHGAIMERDERAALEQFSLRVRR